MIRFFNVCSVVFVFLMMTESVNAADWGVMGDTYPILETDFLEWVKGQAQDRMKNGLWNQAQRRVQNQAVQYSDRPPSVGLIRTKKARSWLWDPSSILTKDIWVDGRLLVAKGTRINPLHWMTFHKTLVFYDSDDPKQVQYVLDLEKKKRVQPVQPPHFLILVNGLVQQESHRFHRPIYFDQKGLLTSRWGIRHVPAIVKAEGEFLRIREVAV